MSSSSHVAMVHRPTHSILRSTELLVVQDIRMLTTCMGCHNPIVYGDSNQIFLQTLYDPVARVQTARVFHGEHCLERFFVDVIRPNDEHRITCNIRQDNDHKPQLHHQKMLIMKDYRECLEVQVFAVSRDVPLTVDFPSSTSMVISFPRGAASLLKVKDEIWKYEMFRGWFQRIYIFEADWAPPAGVVAGSFPLLLGNAIGQVATWASTDCNVDITAFWHPIDIANSENAGRIMVRVELKEQIVMDRWKKFANAFLTPGKNELSYREISIEEALEDFLANGSNNTIPNPSVIPLSVDTLYTEPSYTNYAGIEFEQMGGNIPMIVPPAVENARKKSCMEFEQSDITEDPPHQGTKYMNVQGVKQNWINSRIQCETWLNVVGKELNETLSKTLLASQKNMTCRMIGIETRPNQWIHEDSHDHYYVNTQEVTVYTYDETRQRRALGGVSDGVRSSNAYHYLFAIDTGAVKVFEYAGKTIPQTGKMYIPVFYSSKNSEVVSEEMDALAFRPAQNLRVNKIYPVGPKIGRPPLLSAAAGKSEPPPLPVTKRPPSNNGRGSGSGRKGVGRGH